MDSKGNIYAADQAVGAVFIFDPKSKDHVEMIAHGRQANLDMIGGVALDDDDRLFVADSKLHHVLVFNPKHERSRLSERMTWFARAGSPSTRRTGSFMSPTREMT